MRISRRNDASPVALVTGSSSDGDAERPRGLSGITAEWLEHDRIVLEAERQRITGYSRCWWFRLEQQGKVPKRIKLGERKVGWRLSELTAWLETRAALRDAGGADAGAS